MKPTKFDVSGIEFLTLNLDHVESLSVAFVVKVGSAHERDSLAGVSHFLEHVSFRGSESYSMREIKYTIESVGGNLNAFTGRLATVYYFKVPNFQSNRAFDVLKDVVFKPKIEPEDVELERKVILQEYMMSRENPEDRLHDMALERSWGPPYGRPIIGRRETIESITRDDIAFYHDSMYVPDRVKIVVVGDVESLDFDRFEYPDPASVEISDPVEPVFVKSSDFETMRDLEHVHVLLIRKSPGMLSEDYVKLALMNTILGSGMSSYLFEEIREKEGLVYDISSETLTLKSTGIFGIYFSTSPDNVSKTLEKIKFSLSKLDLSEYIDYGKGRMIGKLRMVSESPASLMWFYADQIPLDRSLSPRDLEEMVREISEKELEDFKNELLFGDWNVFFVGPEGFQPKDMEFHVE